MAAGKKVLMCLGHGDSAAEREFRAKSPHLQQRQVTGNGDRDVMVFLRLTLVLYVLPSKKSKALAPLSTQHRAPVSLFPFCSKSRRSTSQIQRPNDSHMLRLIFKEPDDAVLHGLRKILA